MLKDIVGAFFTSKIMRNENLIKTAFSSLALSVMQVDAAKNHVHV
jgi:hypothetical protein